SFALTGVAEKKIVPPAETVNAKEEPTMLIPSFDLPLTVKGFPRPSVKIRWAWAAAAPVLVMVKAVDHPAPTATWGKKMVGVAWETVRVTATLCGLLPAAGEVSVMAPEYVAAASPAGLTETARAAGVVALAGEALSQLPPEVVEAAAEKASTAPALETETLCAAGDEDPT